MNYKNKKIAFIIPSLGMGGAERVTSELANEFSNRNYDVTIILLDNNEICYNLNKDIKIYFVEYDKNKNTFFRNYQRIKRINQIIKNCTIDIVISFLTSANFLALLSVQGTRARIYISERSDPNKASKKIKFIRNVLYRMADRCIFQTEDARKCFSKSIQRKSVIIKNPIKKGLPKWSDIEQHDKTIVTACRLEKSKNIPMLIDTFSNIIKIHSDYRLIIYGDGKEYNMIKERITQMELNEKVILKGRDTQWHRQAIHSTMFILPSNYEGMSNSLLEAMAMGIPVISTDHPIGGARAVIKDGKNGFLIPINDGNILYNKMLEIINDKNLQCKFSNEAIKIREELDIKKIADLWLDCIGYGGRSKYE